MNTTPPSGVAGAIQFSNGSAFASDAANLFWDDTNNRLGIGTNAPTSPLNIKGVTNTGTILLSLENSTRKIIDISDRGFITANAYQSANLIYSLGYGGAFDAGSLTLYGESNANGVFLAGKSDLNNYIIPNLGIGITTPTAKTHIKGSGATSATNALLVQNSAGTAALTVRDDLSAIFGGNLTMGVSGLATLTTFGTTGYYNILGTNTSAGNYAEIYRPNSTGIFSIENGNKNITISNGLGTYSGVDGIVIQAITHNVGIGVASPLASALLDVTSTTKGFLPPRMTTTQKNAIATPAAGLMVYDTTLNQMSYFNSSSWVNF